MRNAIFSFKITPFSELVPPTYGLEFCSLLRFLQTWTLERMLGLDMLLKFLKAQPGVCFVVFNNSDHCLSGHSQP